MYNWDSCIYCQDGKLKPTSKIREHNGKPQVAYECVKCGPTGKGPYWIPENAVPTPKAIYGDYNPTQTHSATPQFSQPPTAIDRQEPQIVDDRINLAIVFAVIVFCALTGVAGFLSIGF